MNMYSVFLAMGIRVDIWITGKYFHKFYTVHILCSCLSSIYWFKMNDACIMCIQGVLLPLWKKYLLLQSKLLKRPPAWRPFLAKGNSKFSIFTIFYCFISWGESTSHNTFVAFLARSIKQVFLIQCIYICFYHLDDINRKWTGYRVWFWCWFLWVCTDEWVWYDDMDT